MKRRTVNLSDEEAQALDRYSDPDSPQARILAGLAGEEAPAYSSDARVMRALIHLGMARVDDEALAEGYRRLARSEDEEDRLWDQASLLMAARLWEDEQ